MIMVPARMMIIKKNVRAAKNAPGITTTATMLMRMIAEQRGFSTTRTTTTANKSGAYFSTAALMDQEHDESDDGGSSCSSSFRKQQQQQEVLLKHQHEEYPRLFTPLRFSDPELGILPNRILMGSMHSGLEGHSMPNWLSKLLIWGSSPEPIEHDDPTLEKMAKYFEERATGGCGLMVTGGIAPNFEGGTGPFGSQLTNSKEMERHKIVTNTVHKVQIPIVGGGSTTTTTTSSSSNGSRVDIPESVPARICMQILHTGRYAYHPFAVSSSSTKSPISPFRAKQLSLNGIQRTVRDFIRTAVLAKEAGYDGVEIMGSEGYLLSQFLAPKTNKRHDQYGGTSLDNRARIILEIVHGTRMAVGNDFIIIFRLSLLDLVDDGLTFDESIELAIKLRDAGVTIINTGIGWHEARIPTIATSVPRGAFAFTTNKLANGLHKNGVYDIPLVATNRINHPKKAEEILSMGCNINNTNENTAVGNIDLVSMARPFLADPEFINKARTYRTNEINTCIGCNQACLDHVFVGKIASCLVNPRSCHETQLVDPNKIQQQETMKTTKTTETTKNPKPPIHFGVIGAGPAGLSFALTASQCGHIVSIYESNKELGGQFNMAKRIPGKEEFYETIRYYNTMLTKQQQQQNINNNNNNNVNIYLNTTISLDDMKEQLSPQGTIDKWIIATGVTPRDPKIPGQEHPNVLSYIDVLKHNKHVGKRVAVIGAGGIGFDVSEYLLHTTSSDDDDYDEHHDTTSSSSLSKADQVNPEHFWKEWGIDTNLKTRGGLAAAASATMTTTTTPRVKTDDNKNEKRSIYLLQRKKGKLGKGLGKTTGWIHRAALTKSGQVAMIDNVQYDRIDENGYLHITTKKKDGSKESKVLEVDNIVICAGQVERDDLQVQAKQYDDDNDSSSSTTKSSNKLSDHVYLIGGAYHAGELDAKRAIDMGTRLAMRFHEHHEHDDDDDSKKSIIPGQHVDKPISTVEEQLYKMIRRFM